MTETRTGGPGLSRRRKAGLVAVAGAAAALGQAPFDFWPLSIVAFAVFLWALATASSARGAGFAGWLGGLFYFGVALNWIVEPFLVDPLQFGWMAPFALLLMAGGLALFWAVAAWLSARWTPPGVARLWALAGALVLAEVARATVLTGFPWAHPGHVLIGSEWLALSAWLGPHGLTALVLLAAAGAAALWLKNRRPLAALSLAPVIALGLLPLTPTAPQADANAPVIRLIQPNAPQHLKWQPEFIPLFFQRGLDMTAAAPQLPGAPLPDLIIWPETSLPTLLNQSDAARLRMSEAAGATPILVGAQRLEGIRARNSLVLLDADGAIVSIYDKHHLVPFGEYLPVDGLMRRIGLSAFAATLPNSFRPGPGPEVVDLGALGRAFAMICYEAIFPGYIRDVPRPDWMVHVTNDAWFGAFSGPYQHLALARLRAAEQGLPVLRAANTGVTAVIDARGRVGSFLPLGQTGYLDVRVPPPLPPTLYARTGDLPILVGVFLITGASILAGRRRRALQLPD
ncbi:MAG: apolipoprotein N-acyltransferase [Pseudomonadota bacterium]